MTKNTKKNDDVEVKGADKTISKDVKTTAADTIASKVQEEKQQAKLEDKRDEFNDQGKVVNEADFGQKPGADQVAYAGIDNKYFEGQKIQSVKEAKPHPSTGEPMVDIMFENGVTATVLKSEFDSVI